MADGDTSKDYLMVRFTNEGELIVAYGQGMEDRTGLYPSLDERSTVEAFIRTTVGRSLLMRQRKREIHDPLTELLRRDPGREMIKERLTRIAGMSFTGTISVLVIDLDYFGRINKEFGQTAGDAVLRWSAGIFRRKTRASDVVVRWGGEEFVIFTMAGMPPRDRKDIRDRDPFVVGDLEGVIEMNLGSVMHNGPLVAQRILGSLEVGPCMLGEIAIKQRATIGVATHFITPSTSSGSTENLFERLFEAADERLRVAKTLDQRGRVHEANPLVL